MAPLKTNPWLLAGLFFLSLDVVTAKPVAIDGGNITFNAPDDFAPLTPEQIDKKFPRQTGTMEAVGNASGSVTICYRVTENTLRPEELPDAQRGIADMLSHAVPGLQWIKNDIVEINGTKWIYYEMTSAAGEGQVHNIEITTSYRGRMFVMNFNSSAQDFAAYQARLKASLDSVKIGDVSTAPLPAAKP